MYAFGLSLVVGFLLSHCWQLSASLYFMENKKLLKGFAPIGRKQYFLDLLTFGFLFGLVGFMYSWLFRDNTLPLVVIMVVALLVSYVFALLTTKRMIDIWANIKSYASLIILTILFFISNISNYFTNTITTEVKNAILTQSYNVSESSVMLLKVSSYTYAISGGLLFVFTVFLFFKKGKQNAQV